MGFKSPTSGERVVDGSEPELNYLELIRDLFACIRELIAEFAESMTDRLYYHDSFLYDFDARVVEAFDSNGRSAIVLDRTAFYPTSGGQVHDLGMLKADGQQIAITEVADEEDGRILALCVCAAGCGNAGAWHGRCRASARPCAAALRAACALGRIHPAFQYAHRQLPHGRGKLHHRS